MIHTVMAGRGDELVAAHFKECYAHSLDADVLQKAFTDLLNHGYVAVEVSDAGEVMRIVQPDELLCEQVDAADIYATSATRDDLPGEVARLVCSDEVAEAKQEEFDAFDAEQVRITKHQRREWRRQERRKHGRRKR